MAATGFLEKRKPAFRTGMKELRKLHVAGIAVLKAGVAEIAAANSFHQFGREEEKKS